MNKVLLSLLMGCSLIYVSSVFADDMTTPGNVPPHDNPICRQAFDHIKLTHQSLKDAIEANDANTVGTIVIANHKYMKDFIKQHPECKPPHDHMMMPPQL